MKQLKDVSQREEMQEENEWEEAIPPRSVLHSSEKEKYPRIFYFILTFLFLVLTIALIAWGYHLHEG